VNNAHVYVRMNGRVKHCVNAIKRAELLPAEATRRLMLSPSNDDEERALSQIRGSEMCRERNRRTSAAALHLDLWDAYRRVRECSR